MAHKDGLCDDVGLKLLQRRSCGDRRHLELAPDDPDRQIVQRERGKLIAELFDSGQEVGAGAGVAIGAAPVLELPHPAVGVLPHSPPSAGPVLELAGAGRLAAFQLILG